MARSSDTRERLFEAAVELIGEKGYHGTSVDEIVERAGVAKGTVYYHFKSKAELFAALLDDGLERLARAFRAEVAAAGSPREALDALVHAELAYIQRYQAFSKLLFSEMWRLDREWQEPLGRLRQDYVSVMRDVLRDGVASGEFRTRTDSDLAASAIFGMVATVALDWLVFSPGRSIEEVYAEVRPLVGGAVSPATAPVPRASRGTA